MRQHMKKFIVSILITISILQIPMTASAQTISWSKVPSTTMLRTVGSVAIYNGCSSNTNITTVLGVIPAGEVVSITGYCDSGSELFYGVSYQGIDGYALRNGFDAIVHYEQMLPAILASTGTEVAQYTEEQLIQIIVSMIIQPTMTPQQKAQAVHDYLCMTVTYDDTMTHLSGYDAIALNTGVCQGYANAFWKIMQAAGVQTDFVGGWGIQTDGTQISHAWNRCLVDGQYYYIDVTWDDEGVYAGTKYLWSTDETLGGTHFAYVINPNRIK